MDEDAKAFTTVYLVGAGMSCSLLATFLECYHFKEIKRAFLTFEYGLVAIVLFLIGFIWQRFSKSAVFGSMKTRSKEKFTQPAIFYPEVYP